MSILNRVHIALLLTMAGILAAAPTTGAEPGATAAAVELFNGHDLSGWVNVNGAASTWSVRDGQIVCSGQPYGFLRTAAMYQNYRVEWECRHAAAGGNSGFFVHADAMPAVGAPYPRSIEIQLYDGDHGSMFGIRGAKIVPLTNPNLKGGSPRAQPIENRALPAGQWNKYVLTSKDGSLELAVNGKVVTRADQCSQRKGYLCLEVEGSEVHFRNLRLTPLPSSTLPANQIAQEDDGSRSIFDGSSFAGWKVPDELKSYWTIKNGVCRGAPPKQTVRARSRDLWTEREYRDFVLVADWRLPAKANPKKLPTFTTDGLYATGADGKIVMREINDAGDSGIYLRGSSRAQVNIWSQPMGSGDINEYHKDAKLPIEVRRACVPIKHADAPFGQWNRFVITMRDDQVTVVLNGETVIDRATLPGVPPRGPIALQYHNDPIEFRNLFIRELD